MLTRELFLHLISEVVCDLALRMVDFASLLRKAGGGFEVWHSNIKQIVVNAYLCLKFAWRLSQGKVVTTSKS